MQYSSKLVEGVLVRRYKRFLADVRLADGSVITAHIANTGAMSGLAEPGLRVWLRDSGSDSRKYPYSWELVEVGGTLISVNTGMTNAIARVGIEQGVVSELVGYGSIRAEVRHGHCRLDFLLEEGAGLGDGASAGRDEGVGINSNTGLDGGAGAGRSSCHPCYLEVKSVTLAADGVARFPDAVSVRGARHLDELERIAASGDRAAILFCVMRNDVREMRPADDIDPGFGKRLRDVIEAGVEALAYCAAVTLDSVVIERPLPLVLP